MSATVVNVREQISPALPVSNAQLVLWWFMATVAMLFAAFASAYLVRRTGTDWQRVSLPSIVWLNTVVLVISSGSMEVARRKLPNRRYTCNKNLAPVRTGRGWLGLSTVLGLLFVVGQAVGWQQLATRGLLLPTNPASSFFYILTGLHGLHLLGGIVLLVVALRTMRQSMLSCAATYWHFLAALWLGVLALLTWV